MNTNIKIFPVSCSKYKRQNKWLRFKEDFLICDWLLFLHVIHRVFTCENIWTFSVADIPIKHWCLYNNMNNFALIE